MHHPSPLVEAITALLYPLNKGAFMAGGVLQTQAFAVPP